MDITRNKFSNAVSVVFSVVLVGLFCVLIRNRLGLDNIVSCAIIAAVLCGIVACLIFFLNRIVNKFSQGKALNDRLIYNIVIIVISLIFVVIRLLMISNVIEVPMSLGANYDKAVATGGLYLNFATVDGIVSSLISVFVSILGNTYFPIILFQFILNVISFVFILFGVKDLMGRMASLAACFGLAVGPVFYSSVASDGIENLILLMFGLIVFITSKYKKSMDEYQVKWYFSLFIGILLGLFGLYHKSLLVLPVIPLVVLWDCNSESTSTKVGNTFAMLAGGLAAFFGPIIFDCFLFGNGGVDGFITTVINSFSSRFGFDFNLSVLERFLSLEWVLVILILCIAYCVLFWKNEDDAGHIMASFAVLILAQMVFTVVGGSNIYPMLALIALLSIGGYSFINLGYDPDASDVYRIDDDMQPAVVQTIGNKVVASDEEIQKVFAENEEKMKASNTVAESGNTSSSEMDSSVVESNVAETKNDQPAISEIANDSSEKVAEEAKDVENVVSLKVTEPVIETAAQDINADGNSDMFEEKKPDFVYNGTSKYTSPEDRKSTDFGMKDADFASLFDGSAIPPKFARGDMYDDWHYDEEETNDTSDDNNVAVEENIVTEDTEVLEKEAVVEEDNNKSEDFGMNNTDFASLFSGSSVPPKFARNDYFDYEEDNEPVDETENEEAEVEQDAAVSEELDENNTEDNEASDKKAYVDTFFSYLYDESVFDQPIEIPEHKEPEEEKYVSNASKFADLDLDLGVDAFDNVPEAALESTDDEQLTVESEDSISEEEAVESEETVFEEEAVESEETVFEEEAVESEETVFEEEAIESEETVFEEETEEIEEVSFEVEEINETEELSFEVEDASEAEGFSFEDNGETEIEDNGETGIEDEGDSAQIVSIDESNIEDEFDFDEVIPKNSLIDSVNGGWDSIVDDSLEASLDKYEKSVEEEVFRALAEFDSPAKEEISVEEAIERKIREEEGFSYEEAISKRLEEEAIKEENGFSLEEAIEKKIEVEASIKAAESRIGFSVEEALEQKLALEESLESIDTNDGVSVEDVLTKKFEVEDALNNNVEESFSIQEAIEQKIDVEREIDEVINKPILDAIDEFEAIDKELLNSENVLLFDDNSFEPVQETVTEELSFEPVQETVTEEFNFEPVQETVTEEFNFEPVQETVTQELNFEPVQETVTEEFNFEPVQVTVTEELSFEPVQETVTEEFNFEPVQETVTQELNFEPVQETVTEEFNFEPVQETVTQELNFEPVQETVTEEFNFESVEESSFVQPVNTDSNYEVEKSIEQQVLEKLDDEEAQQEVKKPVEFIENPLPLPKKHVHRELDYGRSVPQNWMHYDVEVNNSNNFYDI